jgi:hypothetical protein
VQPGDIGQKVGERTRWIDHAGSGVAHVVDEIAPAIRPVGDKGAAGGPPRVGSHVARVEAITCGLAQDEAAERVVADRAGESSRRTEPRTRAGEDGRRAADERALEGAQRIERLVLGRAA